jgi:hypothetical protein
MYRFSKAHKLSVTGLVDAVNSLSSPAPLHSLSYIIQNEERKLCRPPLRAERVFMDRGAWILIMVLFIAVLVGSYWFLLAPAGQGEEQDDE